MQINPAAVRALRERSGITISRLATDVGVQQPHLSNIEAGRRNASDELIIALAAALKVDILAIIQTPAAA